MIKLIVFDLDGTLLTSKKTIAESSLKIIQKCQKAGIQLCLCSGRSLPGIIPIAKQLDMLDQGFICAMNGAIIQNMETQAITRSRCFTHEELQALLQISHQFKLPLTLAEGRKSYWYLPFFKPLKHLFPRILSKNQIFNDDHEFRKAVLSQRTKKLFQIQKQLKSVSTLTSFLSGLNILDVVPQGISKGHAVQIIMEEMQLSADTLNLGEMGRKRSLSDKVVISNTGKTNLEIRALQVFNKALSVDLSDRVIEPGKQAVLKVKVSAKYLRKAKNRPRVLIISNDPVHSKEIITIKVKQ